MLRLRLLSFFVFVTVSGLILAGLGIDGAKTSTENDTAITTTSPTLRQNKGATTNTQSLVGTSSIASEATIPTSSLTLNASPLSVQLQTNSTFKGVLTSTDNSTDPPVINPIANAQIVLQQSTGTATWVDVATATTDASGAYSIALTITRTSTTFRAVFLGDTTYDASQSQNVTVTAFKAVTKIYSTAPSQVKAEVSTNYSARFTVYDSRVSTKPSVVGAKVEVSRKDAFGGSWKRVAVLTTNTNGNVYWKATVSTPTYWKLSGLGTENSLPDAYGPYNPKVTPSGTVYTLPSAAPKPTRLPPQPAAVGSGANPHVSGITDATWKTMVGKSWRSGCPVGRSQLAKMTINYWGFDGYRHRGVIVFKATKKSKFVSAFTKIYNKRIPLHGMYLPDRFGYSSRVNGANDYASMEHDNTSAFNCRWVVGNPGTRSPHSYGTAVDINPFLNPYRSAQGWVPNQWWANTNVGPYTWRSRSDSLVYIMTHSGFRWTYGNQDAQHFDAT